MISTETIFMLLPFVFMLFYYLGVKHGVYLTNKKNKNLEHHRKFIKPIGYPGPGYQKSSLYDFENKYIRELTFQIGDLIHYQTHDFKEKFPKNAEIYHKIGNILRYIGTETGREFCSVKELMLFEDFYQKCFLKLSQDNESFLNEIKELNSKELIDLVATIQGEERDNVFWEVIKKYKN